MKKKNLNRLLIIACCVALPFLAMAQVPPPDPNDTPIDGGLSLLLAAGATYGIKRYRDGKKNRDEVEEK